MPSLWGIDLVEEGRIKHIDFKNLARRITVLNLHEKGIALFSSKSSRHFNSHHFHNFHFKSGDGFLVGVVG
jgi:hypothetical protein